MYNVVRRCKNLTILKVPPRKCYKNISICVDSIERSVAGVTDGSFDRGVDCMADENSAVDGAPDRPVIGNTDGI